MDRTAIRPFPVVDVVDGTLTSFDAESQLIEAVVPLAIFGAVAYVVLILTTTLKETGFIEEYCPPYRRIVPSAHAYKFYLTHYPGIEKSFKFSKPGGSHYASKPPIVGVNHIGTFPYSLCRCP